MICAIVGSRYYQDYETFKKKINEWIGTNGQITMIISGGATGADSLAERYADEYNIQKLIYNVSKEDWNKHGKAAGPIRNSKIINYLETIDSEHRHLIAFPQANSKGTLDIINKAKQKQIPVTIFPC
jgi:hypothetical protein